VTVVAEGVDIVEQRRETSPVMSPVTAGAGAGAKLSEKLSTVASAAFGSTSRIVSVEKALCRAVNFNYWL
jgi:hypothetical protein